MPRLLDLFCGAGGAAMGYHRAGFEVVGVDICPQPHYPFEFVHSDAMDVAARWIGRYFDLVHASPPCQGYSRLAAMHPGLAVRYPRLIEPLQVLLDQCGVPFVIENVEGAPLRDPITLCGSMFSLGVERGWLRRHRLFECSFHVEQPECDHPAGVNACGVYGHGGYSGKHRMLYKDEASQAMGIDWMNWDELTQAIPPAYTNYIGRAFLDAR